MSGLKLVCFPLFIVLFGPYFFPQHSLLPQPVTNKYVDDSDEIILEDEVQRIQLIGSIEVSELVNG